MVAVLSFQTGACSLISHFFSFFCFRSLMERVEILRKAKEERVAKVKAESVVAFPAAMGVDDDDDSEDEDDDDIAYDWRAKEI
jgi:hypothetical protein